MGIWHLVKEGGFIMYPLLFCSLVVWAVAMEKAWSLIRFKKELIRVHQMGLHLAKEGKLLEAKGLFASIHPLIASAYLEVLQTSSLSKELQEEKIARRFVETKMGLKKFLWILGTIGAMAPFIGLFGTVVGIIKAFESMAQTGKSGFAVVAGGLSEALVATAAGILVAIVAVIFYNFFLTWLNNLQITFEHAVADFRDSLHKEK
ncbi:MAG: MotA/TolQ/ExbB proton channel family protein [Bacteriovoracaceae bacterium]|nr:MotA/TolQ/ExbB proton channel family protein [Bacteriovoracaceae bacterium]